jgi:23S rRNA pseudouridine2605 synthase
MPERLQKILARHGLGSRREIERWIAEGRVTVNHQPAKIGAQFQPGDRIAIDGKEVTARLAIEVAPQVLLFHKAQGQSISHEDRTKRPPGADDLDEESVRHTELDSAEAVVDRLPAVRGTRWVPINPMHAGDSGLLLLTNDGTLSYALTRRKRWIPTAYMVRVLAPGHSPSEGNAPPEIPPHVSYDAGRGTEEVEFTSVEPAGGEGSNLWYRVELARADRRAAVRALFESRDIKVSRMTQVAFGSIQLPRDLPRGRHRTLTTDQVAGLYELAQIKMPQPPTPSDRTTDSPPTRRGIAPDRRQPAKRRSSAASNKTLAKPPLDIKFAKDREGKRAVKAQVPKKTSTWRIGGKKRPQGDSRR